MAPWEHSFWGGQRLEFSDKETIFPTKPTAVNPPLISAVYQGITVNEESRDALKAGENGAARILNYKTEDCRHDREF